MSNFKKWDLAVWTPVSLCITGIERNDLFMANVLRTLQNYYVQNIMPEGLTRKIETNSALKISYGQKDKL